MKKCSSCGRKAGYDEPWEAEGPLRPFPKEDFESSIKDFSRRVEDSLSMIKTRLLSFHAYQKAGNWKKAKQMLDTLIFDFKEGHKGAIYFGEKVLKYMPE